MGAAVLIAKECLQLKVRVERNIFLVFNGVQIGNEWDRNPVISGYSGVPADDDAVFAGIAPPQGNRSRSTDTVEVDRCVTGARKGAIVTVRLF
jgi:hypothetical protein